MSEVKIAGALRTDFGKGAARRTRREGRVPGVVYGHGEAPQHVSLPGHDLMMALKTANVLLSLELDGASQLVIPKAVQKDPLRGSVEHVDLLVVKRGEKVTVDVPVVVEGELAPGANLIEHMLNALPVEAEATHIPETLTVSVEGLEAGASILASDVVLPAGTTLTVDGETVVLQIVAAQAEAAAADEEADEAGETAAAEAAEG